MIGRPQSYTNCGDFPYDPTSTGIISALTEDALTDSVSKATKTSVNLLQSNEEVLSLLRVVANLYCEPIYFGDKELKSWAREILVKYKGEYEKST